MLALSAVLSAAFVSALAGASSLVTSAFGASTFSATAAATLSLVFSTFAGCASAFGASSFAPAFVVLSAVVLLETSSAAWDTAPAPKKILAPITTDAVPTLNFLIEYDSTFVPSLVVFKYLLFFPTIKIPPIDIYNFLALN